MAAKAPLAERQQTDEGLAVERAKTDLALGHEQADIEDKADAVIERAREEADDVLLEARAQADVLLRSPLTAATPGARSEARALEDEALRDERDEADSALREERRASARLIAQYLPLDRGNTDRHLTRERARSDDAIAHRDDFLGLVSHDLRDLVAGIALGAEFIADNVSPDDKGQRALKAVRRVQRSASQMSRLIGDLLDIASIDAGKLAIHPAPGDAAALVLESIELWGPAAAAHQIVLEAPVAAPAPATFDHDRVLQILGNLITNAVKVSAAGGSVTVGVEAVGDAVRFSVGDAGPGIPEDKLQAVFERFVQVGPRDRRGLGLGLYISKCLVDAHGGEIWAESALGVGSTFSFTLPARR